jgi:hypothetical protein
VTQNDDEPFEERRQENSGSADEERRRDDPEPFDEARPFVEAGSADESRDRNAAMTTDDSGSDRPVPADGAAADARPKPSAAASEDGSPASPPTDAGATGNEAIWSPPPVDQATTAPGTAWEATAPETLPLQPAAPILPFEIPQPKPWQPSDDELDPTADTGWERAAEHELVAVRPEDVPAILAVQAAGPLDPAVAREAIATHAGSPGTLPPVGTRAWSSPGSNPAGTSAAAAAGSIAASSGAFAAPAGASGPFAGGTPAWPNGATAGTAGQPGTNLIDFPQPAPEVALAPTERRWRRASRRVKTGLEAAARPVLLLALFALGVSLGWAGYVGTRPLPAAAPVATLAPGTTTDVPPQVQSLIAAMNADDQSQLQVIVPSDAYRLLAGALTQEGVKSIRGAKALWTYTSGEDSATEILVSVTTSDGSNFTFNLVVHLHDGMITEFR